MCVESAAREIGLLVSRAANLADPPAIAAAPAFVKSNRNRAPPRNSQTGVTLFECTGKNARL
jgi:hypothetical protein